MGRVHYGEECRREQNGTSRLHYFHSIFQESQSSTHGVHRLGTLWKTKLGVLRDMSGPLNQNATPLAPLLTRPLVLLSREEELLKSGQIRAVGVGTDLQRSLISLTAVKVFIIWEALASKWEVHIVEPTNTNLEWLHSCSAPYHTFEEPAFVNLSKQGIKPPKNAFMLSSQYHDLFLNYWSISKIYVTFSMLNYRSKSFILP